MLCTPVDLFEILKFTPQPLAGGVRLLFTVVVFYVLTSRDTGSVGDFTCHPETKDGSTEECFSTYSAEMSSFMHPQFFVIITAVVLFFFWSVMILYSYRQREKIKRTSDTAVTKMKAEFWGKVLLHVRCEAVFIIVSLGLFCCTQKIHFAETYNCIPRNAPVEIVLTCRDKRQQDKKDLNIYFIGGMISILLCCMWVICRAKKCEVYFKDLVDLTVTKSEAGYDGNQRSETPMLNADVVSCSFAVASDQSDDEQQGDDGSQHSKTPMLNADVVSGSSSRASDQSDDKQQVIQRKGAVKRGRNTLEDLVNDPSDSLEKICFRLDLPIGGLDSYEAVARYYHYSLFEIRSRFGTSPDGPSKDLILSITAEHPDVTVENFAKVVEMQTIRVDVARLLREFDLKG
ncbi:uncharacterized protein LOC122961756 [Acropora millepora]|uniref:uncharacterized protein LOC122961756 n=1 Tax=Acropora millepora TaxID=45264 RepID=UPI001CF4CC9A|nr:uncharacterized protein LOC122961756 [Acropora millepora]